MAYGVELVAQVTFILGRYDPARIFQGNPDAPPDEYESEAESILRQPLGSEARVLEVTTRVFRESFEGESIDEQAIARAARDIYAVTSAT